MGRRTVISGIGIISALGDAPGSVHAALCEGGTAFRDIEFSGWDGLPATTPRGAEIPDFSATRWLGDVNLRPLERSGQLSISAALLALGSGGWTAEMREEVEVDLVLATAFGSVGNIASFDRITQANGPRHAKPLDFANTVINAPAGQTAIWHHLTGSNTTVCAGKTSSLRALKPAARAISDGKSHAVLVGGVETMSFVTHTGYSQSGHLQAGRDSGDPVPFHRDRQGFLLGEGSAFLVLEEAGAARARGAQVLAEIRGCGSSFDPGGGQVERPAVEACARSIRAALVSAELSPDQIGLICSSASGAVSADRIEVLALAEVFGPRLAEIPLFAPAGALGETLGASGMLQVVTLIESMRAGCVPGSPGADGYDAQLPACGFRQDCQRGHFANGLAISTGLEGSSAAAVISTASWR